MNNMNGMFESEMSRLGSRVFFWMVSVFEGIISTLDKGPSKAYEL